MTGPERRTPPGEAAQRLWRALKQAGEEGLTAGEAEDAGFASAAYARRIMRSWTEAGLATHVAPKRPGGVEAGVYVLADHAPDVPPVRTTAGTVVLREAPAMSAAEFARTRRRLGLSLGGMALALEWTGSQPSRARGMKRFESGARPIDAALAAKVRALE